LWLDRAGPSEPTHRAETATRRSLARTLLVLEHFPIQLNRFGFPFEANSDSSLMLVRRPASMTKPLSDDIRIRIISAVDAGMSCRAAADRFSVVPSTAINVVRRHRETGEISSKPQGGDRRSGRVEAHAAAILGLIKNQRDITLAEIVEAIFETTGERFGTTTIWRLLKRHGQTFKKNRARERTGTPRRRGTA
jgi:transposase